MIDFKILQLKTVEKATETIANEEERLEQPRKHSQNVFQELFQKIDSWSNFRDEISQKIDDIFETLSNAVDKRALIDLKAEVKDLMHAQSSINEQLKEPLVTAQELQQMKEMMEEKLQYLHKSLQELSQNLFPFYEMKETISSIKDSEDLLKCDIDNIRKEVLKLKKQVDEEHGELHIQ